MSSLRPTRPARLLALAAIVGFAVPISGAAVSAAAEPADIGGTIAFVSDRTGNDEVYLLDPETGAVRQLTDSPGFDRAPGWSPDGSSIVFNSRREPHADRPQIYVLDVATGVQTRVTDSPLEEQRATWSPDGTALYFHRGAFLSQPYNLVRHELSTGTETTLTDSSDAGVWNAAAAPRPGTDEVLFQSNRADPSSLFPQRLFLLDESTGALTGVPGPAGLDDASLDGPRWNRDGSAYVYSASTDDGNTLYLGTGGTWTSIALTDGQSEDSSPAFSPDGTAIVFQTYLEGETEDEDRTVLRVLDLASGVIVELGEGRTPVWTDREWFDTAAQPELAETGSAASVWIIPLGLLAVAGGAVLASHAIPGRRRGR